MVRSDMYAPVRREMSSSTTGRLRDRIEELTDETVEAAVAWALAEQHGGRLIRDARDVTGQNQAQAARDLGIAQPSLSHFESGYRPVPSWLSVLCLRVLRGEAQRLTR